MGLLSVLALLTSAARFGTSNFPAPTPPFLRGRFLLCRHALSISHSLLLLLALHLDSSPGVPASMARLIDPTVTGNYPVILGDGLLGKTSNEIFTGVRCMALLPAASRA